MLRRFLHNTAISAVAFGLAGVLGLFSVGLIAKFYGLAVLGLIALARSFLPNGFLSLIDFGVSETTTQMVARGRLGDWAAASERVSFLTVVAVITGLVSSVVLWFAAPVLAVLFKVAQEEMPAFISILKVTALITPIAFVGLVVEGVLKGFEEYGWLRMTEVGGSVLYVAAIYLAVWSNLSFEWIAYAYLATVVVKYLVLALIVAFAMRRTSLRFGTWSRETRDDLVYRGWLMFNARIGGVLQQTIIPLAIGALYGPAQVGAYDLLMRLPRFLKAVLSPLFSAILPISAHIDEKTDVRRLQLLGRNSFVLPAAIVIPIVVLMALYSEEILKVWVGPQSAEQWPWLALALIVPAANVMISAGQTALMVRADFMRFANRYLYSQVAVQYAVTAITLHWFQDRAFIVGWVVSYVVLTPVLAHRMLRLMGLPRRLFWQHVARQALVAAILAVLVRAYKIYVTPETLPALIVAGATGCIAAWALSMMLILSRGDRAMFGKFARAMTNR
ncbi:teichoic acid transporter [Bradyrhizobium centrolobii]|uniref:Teichoic acid transporter n=1 Tax=Bradyrhizobium centrolobii TaxID=1505087 RepID=A0A176YCT2_9BRAD|nr:oligosaccharide flippase family protein [Bradyrhizobium centrolobii]OAF01235.1 teichoic acid transporter [Bradyrhizobium centrolobii]